MVSCVCNAFINTLFHILDTIQALIKCVIFTNIDYKPIHNLNY